MNPEQARQILARHRPGVADADAQFAAALDQTRRDPQLREWFEHHCAFQSAMRDQIRQLPVPPSLKQAILARRPVVVRPLFWWRRPTWLAAATILMIGIGLALWWSQQRVPDRFADYRGRMVRTALRQYRMDLLTNDRTAMHQFLTTNGAPVDFVVPAALEQLSLTGGGLLRWRGHKVSMVCFDRGDQQMLFLFVVDRSAVKEAPPSAPELIRISKLQTASWTRGDHAYLLAGPDGSEPFRRLP